MRIFRWLFGEPANAKSSAAKVESSGGLVAFDHQKDSRRRRQDIPYLLPKDIEEGARLNLQHYLLRYALKANFMAPISDDVKQILDVGSGTGIWGQEVARQFPSARVFGLDLEPPSSVSLTASAALIPQNYHFVQGNVLTGLPFPDRLFDFAHQRMLVLALRKEDWPRSVQELVRVTRVGGWVEMLELGTKIYNAGPATERMLELSNQFLARRGFDGNVAAHIAEFLTGAGLRNVDQHILDIPIGTWDTRLGTLLEKDILAAWVGIKAGICGTLNIEPEEYDRMLAMLPKEWKQYRSHHRFYLAYGQV